MTVVTSSSQREILAPTPEVITELAHLLIQGEIVAIPTETVYGLAADATSDRAVAKIYALKKRPVFNPLILHFAHQRDIFVYAQWTPQAEKVANAFWPGPLTLILNQVPHAPLSLLASAGLSTVGVRVPALEVTRALIQAVGKPLAAPSANPSESISPTSAQAVVDGFGPETSLKILDGGPCTQGIESTILDLSGAYPTLLRPGCITREMLEEVLGTSVEFSKSSEILKAPGQMKRHYAPSLPMRLQAQKVSSHEALLAFGPDVPSGAAKTLNLSLKGDLQEAAVNLFAMMRALDNKRYKGIAVMPIPATGIGLALNDRLERAAYPIKR